MGIEKGVGFPITATDNFSGQFDKLTSKVGAASAAMSGFARIIASVTGAGLGAMVASFVQASEDAMQAQRKLEAVLRATGNATGYSTRQLNDLADALSRTSQFDDEAFRHATATLVRFGNIGGQNLEKVLKLSADYAAVTGGDLVSAAETLGKALNNPAEGLKRLERNFGDLGKETEDAIKLQAAMGNQAGALGIAIEALQKKIGGADQTMNAGLTGSVNQLRKALSELMEAGGSMVDNSATVGILDAITARLRGIKTALEGPWSMKLLAILGGGKTLEALGNLKPEQIIPGAGGGSAFSLSEQDARADAYLRKVVENNRKAADEIEAYNEKMRKLDAAGWVKYIEDMQKKDEESLLAMAKNAEEYYKTKAELRGQEEEGQTWLKQNVLKIAEEEQRQLLELERQSAADRAAVWSEASSAAGNFFSDLVMNGKSAFDNLRQYLKQLLAQMLQIFAQRWILQLGAAAMGGGSTSSGAALLGQASSLYSNAGMAGSILSAGGTFAGAYGAGMGLGGSMSLALGGTAGVGPVANGAAYAASLNGGAAGMGWVGAAGIAAIVIAGMMIAQGQFARGWTVNGTDNLSGAARYNPGVWANRQEDRFFRGLGFNDEWAGILSGSSIVSRIFGNRARQNDAYGVRGTVGAGGVTGENWQDWSEQGGWFSDTNRGTDPSAFSTEQQAFFTSMMRGIGDIVDGFAGMVGVDGAAATAGFSRAFNLQMNENGEPLDDAALTQLFGNFFGGVLQEQVAMVFDASGNTALAEYVRELKGSGEEITGFIQELLGVMQGLRAADILGMDVETLMKFQRDGESLSQTFERVGGAWSQFQGLFYSDAERLAQVQGAVNNVFADLGIAVPDSMEGFRALVEGLDLTTESGRRMFEALMGVAPAFASIEQAAEAAVNRFHTLAGQLSPGYGAANARSILDASVRSWMDLTPGNGEAGGWTVDSTISNIGSLIASGNIGAALTYAQSLGGSAVGVLNDMLAAYLAWQEAMGNATPAIGGIVDAIDEIGGAARRAKDGLWEYLKGLMVSPGLSPLDPMTQLQIAKTQFAEQIGLAQGGDVGALGGLQGYIDKVLNLGRGAYGSSSSYVDLFNWAVGLAGDLVKPGGGQELMSLQFAETQAQTNELREIKALLMQIAEQGPRLAEDLASATADSGEKVSRTMKATVALR